MTRLVPYLVALFWVLAYVAGGWWGVLLVALVGVAGELVLFAVVAMQDEVDRSVGVARLEAMEAEDSTRKRAA